MNVALIHFADCPSATKLDLLDIRNGFDVRRFSLDTKFITIAEHRHWVERVSADPLCLPFCVVEAASSFCHGCIFGVLADSDRQTCKVSFYLNHEARSLGIGASVVHFFADLLFLELGINQVHLVVSLNNQSCLRLVLKLGFCVSKSLAEPVPEPFVCLNLSAKRWTAERPDREARFARALTRNPEEVHGAQHICLEAA